MPTFSHNPQDKQLCKAVRKKNMEGVKAALQDGANPNCHLTLALGETIPLFICARKGLKDIAQVLIEYGANVNTHGSFDGATPLHLAANNNRVEFVEYLLEKGGDPDPKTKLGRTPFMEASQIGSIKICQILLKNGANINHLDSKSRSPLR